MLFVLKLCLTPLLIGGVALAGRRWGPLVSGLLIGLPLTTGPVSFFLAVEQGTAFATQAAVGGLLGQVSICLFCLAYSRSAPRLSWPLSTLCASLAFLLSTALLNLGHWTIWAALALLLLAIGSILRIMPKGMPSAIALKPPRWDLPARMLVATGFVLVITAVANQLGPQLSGLIAPFPVFGLVFAAFAHAQQGSEACAVVLRGIVLGSGAYTAFFAIVGFGLPVLGIALTYPLAALAAIGISGLFYHLSRCPRRT